MLPSGYTFWSQGQPRGFGPATWIWFITLPGWTYSSSRIIRTGADSLQPPGKTWLALQPSGLPWIAHWYASSPPYLPILPYQGYIKCSGPFFLPVSQLEGEKNNHIWYNNNHNAGIFWKQSICKSRHFLGTPEDGLKFGNIYTASFVLCIGAELREEVNCPEPVSHQWELKEHRGSKEKHCRVSDALTHSRCKLKRGKSQNSVFSA